MNTIVCNLVFASLLLIAPGTHRRLTIFLYEHIDRP